MKKRYSRGQLRALNHSIPKSCTMPQQQTSKAKGKKLGELVTKGKEKTDNERKARVISRCSCRPYQCWAQVGKQDKLHQKKRKEKTALAATATVSDSTAGISLEEAQ